jgi:hypothetical protein
LDQGTLISAKEILRLGNHKKVKVRNTDGASPKAPFRYPNLLISVSILPSDVGRYFHSFPLASEIRDYFYFFYNGAWSEFKQWILFSLHIETCHLIDDWGAFGRSYEETMNKLLVIEHLLKSVGF